MSEKVETGKKVPDFKLNATGDKIIRLSKIKNKNIILYFYPKDNTPGCTTEGKDFNALFNKFSKADTVILGVSRDSIKTHENFKAKHGFKFDLLSDTEEKLCKLFDVIKLKKLYGREYLGIERSTFLLDKNHKLIHEWRKVKVKDHAQEVLQKVLELNE